MNQYQDNNPSSFANTVSGALKNVATTVFPNNKYPTTGTTNEDKKPKHLKLEDSTKLSVSTSESYIGKSLQTPPQQQQQKQQQQQQLQQLQQQQMYPRRVWVKLPNGTPTTVLAFSQDIIDDLKTAIISKYPHSIASFADAADIQLLIEQTPTSPISVSNKLTKNNSIKLEPDKNVWQVIDTYYPQGMSLHEALIIEVGTDGTSSYVGPRYSESHITEQMATPRDTQFLKLHNHNVKHPQPIQVKRSPSQMSNQYYNQQPQSGKYPRNAYNIREMSVSPSSLINSHHRRSHSNPLNSPLSNNVNLNTENTATTTGENPKAVLLLPKNFSLAGSGTGNTKKRNQSLYDNFGSEGFQKDDIGKPEEVIQEETNQEISEKQEDEQPKYKEKDEERTTIQKSTSKEQLKQEKPKPDAAKDKVLPSISVLIVEDNAINQAILGAFLRKRKIHYQIAKNGQEAIDKWRSGGFHLVLMDIQLPVKSGIEATKEIRHLEKLNKIGVFDPNESSTINSNEQLKEQDKLDLNVFRSPVIIVALTASSNSSVDRKNALTAGCNDYLTKPVNLVWLQDKITEWGCMQALIDFEGWKSRNVGLWKKAG